MSDITILICTSPRPTHPDTRILDQTIISVRAQLPNAPIIIMADGLRVDSDRLTHAHYSGFLSNIEGRYDHTHIIKFPGHSQQSGMIGPALELVKTPIILYLEDDWKLHPDIEWEKLCAIIQSGYANYVRFYANCRIHPLHEGMMCGRVIEQGVPLIKTLQWSQNPHLASTEFYRTAVLPFMEGRGKEAIENLMHQACQWYPDWERWKLTIYNPENTGTTQMCTHLDGRQQ